ncbi:unnamed protein product [Linum tenue]|uniref:TIP41-like protein n=1 Tax=Linum tenue TaxID=586396 RepID=A0AAV0L002_9ROSI|nr:unnamed protein product [Linum tenue]
MADCVDDAEFWLPPKFLTDDDIFLEKKPHQMGKKGGQDVLALDNALAAKSLFNFDFPYGFGSFGVSSDLSSPVESVVGSTETESDEEDHLAGLTRQMAQTTLEDDFARSDWLFGAGNAKGRVLSGSPQSTLCGAGNGCGCKLSLNRPVKVSLLYAAGGEVAKMKINGGGGAGGGCDVAFNDQSRGLLGGPPATPPSPVTVPVKTSNTNADVGFYPHQSLSYQQLQASQFQQLRQQQMMKQHKSAIWAAPQNDKAVGIGVYQQPLAQQQNRGRSNNNGKPLGLSASAWPSLQQPQQQQVGGASGLRAVNPGGKNECAGTGVFLPRPRKKPNATTLRNNHPSSGGGWNQTRSLSSRAQAGMEMEVRLPQEWTY